MNLDSVEEKLFLCQSSVLDSNQIKVNEWHNGAIVCLSLRLSVHLIILLFIKSIHHSHSGVFPTILNYSKNVSVCVPSIGATRNASIMPSSLFFPLLLSFTKGSEVTRCMSRLLCSDGSQNNLGGDVLDWKKWGKKKNCWLTMNWSVVI